MAVFLFAHRRHTGRKIHHGQTSYSTLAFLLMLCGVLLSSYSISAVASGPLIPTTQSLQDGSIGLSGAVRGIAPTQPAIILMPVSGYSLSSSPTSVSGVCPRATYVSLYRNGVFSGLAACKDDGTYNLLVDLLAGQNKLVAKVSDILDQTGPDSTPVMVFYSQPVVGGNAALHSAPFFLLSDAGVEAISLGQSLQRIITIKGGSPPYAVNWDFGDDTNTALPQASSGDASASHIYSKAGTYTVIVRVTDSNGNTAIIQLVDVVNDTNTNTVSSISNKFDLPGAMPGAWPIYFLAVMMVIVFWLGERRELYIMRKKTRLS